MRPRNERFKPLLAVIRTLLAEGQVDEIASFVLPARRVIEGEVQLVRVERRKISLGFRSGRRSETLRIETREITQVTAA